MGSVTGILCEDPRFPRNSLKQTICDVTQQLGKACDPSKVDLSVYLYSSGSRTELVEYSLGAGSPGDVYHGPREANANQCRCSSVFYSTLSACALCQGADIVWWSEFTSNCTTIYLRQFPAGIPPGTAVPAWAFEDVTEYDSWQWSSMDVAHGESMAPPSRAVSSTEARASRSALTGTGTTAAPSSTASSDDLNADASGSSRKAPNVIVIVVGSVGALFTFLLILYVIFWFLRRRRKAASAPTGTMRRWLPDSNNGTRRVQADSERNDHHLEQVVTGLPSPWDDEIHAEERQMLPPSHADVYVNSQDFEPPPYEPSGIDAGSMYASSTYSGDSSAALSSGTLYYASEKAPLRTDTD